MDETMRTRATTESARMSPRSGRSTVPANLIKSRLSSHKEITTSEDEKKVDVSDNSSLDDRESLPTELLSSSNHKNTSSATDHNYKIEKVKLGFSYRSATVNSMIVTNEINSEYSLPREISSSMKQLSNSYRNKYSAKRKVAGSSKVLRKIWNTVREHRDSGTNVSTCSAEKLNMSSVASVDHHEADDLPPSILIHARVLVVDDASLNRKMLCRLLKDRCGVVHEAENGQVAVDMVIEAMTEDRGYHIVLMDYQMPVMDGPTACRRIRSLGYLGIILGVTGNAMPEDIQHFIAHGANKVFPKPFDITQLELVVSGKYSYGIIQP